MSLELQVQDRAYGGGVFARLRSNEDISQYSTVAFTSDSTMTIQDANCEGSDSSKYPAIGIVPSRINNAFGRVMLFGFITNPDWNWNEGAILYQSDTDGAMSETAGTYEQQVAVASTSTTILFWPKHIDYDLQI